MVPPVLKHVPSIAKHPSFKLMPLANEDDAPKDTIEPESSKFPSVVVARPTPSPPDIYVSLSTFSLARSPKVEVAMPTAPDDPEVVEAVEIMNMEKVEVAVEEVAIIKALARLLGRVVVAA